MTDRSFRESSGLGMFTYEKNSFAKTQILGNTVWSQVLRKYNSTASKKTISQG